MHEFRRLIPARVRHGFALSLLVGSVALAGEPAVTKVWKVAELGAAGMPVVERLGSPATEDQAVRFDGKGDGLFVSENPLAGASHFTIQILFRPAEGGLSAQRFFHLQDERTNRVMIETRLDGKGGWWLDTFLGNSGGGKPLIDPAKVHPTDQWYWAAVRYDGKVMSDYVNGVKELAAEVSFGPLLPGQVSLGVRQTKVYWFKGLIREVRFTPEAIDPDRLERVAARP